MDTDGQPTLTAIRSHWNFTGPCIFVNKVLLKHSHALLFTYCLWLLFTLQEQSAVVARETVLPAKPN